MGLSGRFGLKTRLIVYVTIVVALYLYRGNIPWRNLTQHLQTGAPGDTTLVLSGCDLAPDLIPRLVAHYRRDYPDLTIEIKGGGSNQALEDLLNDQASVGFLYRRPTAGEQDLFRSADGDTAIVTAVALGAVVLVAGAETDDSPLSPDTFIDLLNGDNENRYDRLYVPDPNEGLWDAVWQAQGRERAPEPAADKVVFVADARAVLMAVADDARGWGLFSSLDGPDVTTAPPPDDVSVVPVRAAPDSLPALPTYENVATGAYPLYHAFYVGCRSGGGPEGGKFLTHLSSARGLRQIERAGVLPARQVLREIYLSTEPIGG